ncbi:MAG: SCO family protein [Candidatus Omnitrophica bacterium]|nr:SCO family protein [Candidatus Omnitrophota bacterium]
MRPAIFCPLLLAWLLSCPAAAGESGALPDYGALSEFTLKDSRGGTFSRGEMEGQVWVADFIFTRCTGTCPRMSLEMGRLQKELPGVGFLSFTADPAHDTPEVLGRYAKDYGAGDRWVFLTGAPEVLNRVSASLHLGLGEDPATHSVRFILIDRQGRIRGYYDPTEKDYVAKIRRDLSLLGD